MDGREAMSTEQSKTVVNVFTNPEEAQAAVQELLDRGFSRDQIGFAMAGRETILDESGNYGNEGAAAGIVAGASAGAL